ncbi:hypothetical protein D9758_004094 [Tetrapyrgos nigripes]|uniref:polynucleotide adenylyltransferase n=1 Tax=Tetrapyrgos nigripes TaxID=182062 RepID=A0A8H5GUB0_9AGAR|nr:hypothetical protein D9758_004094 [Tetrapyrgos nigripes]
MNIVKEINRINDAELKLGTTASWHDDYKDSAYIFAGGLNTELTEGDVVTIFSQYGEIMDINMPRDKETGKPKGFAFLMYEDQRSTTLAVDNLNGAKVLERTLRVDHVRNYKQPKTKGENGEWHEAEEQSFNAKPEIITGENEESESSESSGPEIDPEDPMRDYLLEKRREEKALKKKSKSKGKGKHKDETPEERRARKARKKEKKEKKERRKAEKSEGMREVEKLLESLGGRDVGRGRSHSPSQTPERRRHHSRSSRTPPSRQLGIKSTTQIRNIEAASLPPTYTQRLTSLFHSFGKSSPHFLIIYVAKVSDCISPDPANTLTDRINIALNSSSDGYILKLCPSTQYLLQAPILFAFPNQEISTVGYPTDDTRATVVVNGPVSNGAGHTTAVDGTCTTCSGVKLRNIQIDGARGDASPTNGGANIEMGGSNSGQVIEYVRSFNPRSWSCLHISEGNLDCEGATIQNNDIGPCGVDTFQQWADGISVACQNSVVRNNMIEDPTDGGIVLFGSPGTQVYNNTIWAVNQTLLGGINLVDYMPWNGNFSNVVVYNNTILGGFATDRADAGDTKGENKEDVIVKIGIAIGPMTWFGDRYGKNVTSGGTVKENRFSGAFSYAIALTSATNFVVENNVLFDNTSFIGSRGPNCSSDDVTPTPAAFVIDQNTVSSSTTQSDFTSIQDGNSLTCVLPPDGGDFWPYGGGTGEQAPGSGGSGSSAGRNAGIALGIIFGILFVAISTWLIRVHGPGSDIDTLCVVPKHVSREDFFEVFEPMLRDFEGATEVAGVPEAYVPIITANINGIPLDFLMARLALSTIPEDLSLQDDNLLRNIDERCVRSLGGSRVANAILELVPNVQVFRDSLRCIKLWAQRRAIYSNVNGFFGGVAWAMLVARICQLYPNAIAGAIVSRFFIIMYQWSWPQPVLLKQIEEGPLQVKVWNPKLYPSDRSHRMPIITPTYPAMCATHNVTASTQMITTEEFKRGADIVDKVIVGSASWSELFTKHDFFHKYRYYLQIIASTGNADLQIKWSGTVESRIRQLVMKLEYVDSLMLAHPFVKGFDQVSYCISDEEVRAVAQGDISETIAKRKKEDIEGKEGAGPVYTTTFYVGLAVEPKQPGSVGPRRLDISYPTTEFTKLVKMWEKFDESTMGIVVRNIKSSSLPDNVFDPGERQPKPAQKRTKGSSKSSNTSPEMPSSKRIRTLVPPSKYLISPQLVICDSLIRSNNSSKEQPTTPTATTANANGSIPPLSVTPVVETAGAFAPKDPADIKSPQLPLGENAAIATSVQ